MLWVRVLSKTSHPLGAACRDQGKPCLAEVLVILPTAILSRTLDFSYFLMESCMCKKATLTRDIFVRKQSLSPMCKRFVLSWRPPRRVSRRCTVHFCDFVGVGFVCASHVSYVEVSSGSSWCNMRTVRFVGLPGRVRQIVRT